MSTQPENEATGEGLPEQPLPPEPESATPAGNGTAEAAVVAEEESPPGAGPSVEDPLAVAERQRDEYLALAQRTQADFENFRRRAARDTAAAGARAKAGLVRELLPVVDNLERALASAGAGDEGLAHGVRLVHTELVGALERAGIQGYAPAGEPFDPQVHEAISTRPAEGTDAGVVLDVVEKGYRLDDTILRPARVVVSA